MLSFFEDMREELEEGSSPLDQGCIDRAEIEFLEKVLSRAFYFYEIEQDFFWVNVFLVLFPPRFVSPAPLTKLCYGAPLC